MEVRNSYFNNIYVFKHNVLPHVYRGVKATAVPKKGEKYAKDKVNTIARTDCTWRNSFQELNFSALNR
jgi:hypothetical protein